MTLKDTHAGLLKSVKDLCVSDEICRDACSKFCSMNVLHDRDERELLEILAQLLLNKHKTLIVAQHFPKLLPQLLALALDVHTGKHSQLPVSQQKVLHEKCCVALGKLITVHPDSVKFMLMYFAVNPAPFHVWGSSDSKDEPRSKKRKLLIHTIDDDLVTDEDIALCCFSFLKEMTEHFRNLWDWSQFMSRFLNHKESFVKWLACECSALLFCMSEEEKQTFLETKLDLSEITACSVHYSFLVSVLELKQNNLKDQDEGSPIDIPKLNSGEFNSVVTIGGVVLPVLSKKSAVLKSSIVLVESTLSNLQAVALGIATGRPLCLQGPVGCGKTSLVEYLASLTGRVCAPSFLSVQLGDQTDSKMLLGTYQCTDIPGEFVWQPGVLTQAIVEGHWLLLEDIDSCSTDVAAVLSSLLETGTLNVPGYRDCVRAAPGFQLFLTQRLVSGATGFHKQHMGASSMLQKHWLPVQIEPMPQSELVDIVQTLYPKLKTVAQRIVNVFLMFSSGSHHSALKHDENTSDPRKIYFSGAGMRLISTRDLIKWCNRAVVGFNVTSSDSALKVLQDAIDIFCCNVSNSGVRLSLAESVAATLGVIHTKAEYFCNVHKPSISTSMSHIIAGRQSLPKKQSEVGVLSLNTKMTFSFTRPAAALLERISCCIALGEPVLLVGETGVGKTSSIQYLARQIGHTLSVINMNQQSDSMDLLGGYKPVEFKYVVSPIRDEFETLFRQFFSVDENANFLSHIASCFSARRWKTLVSLMRHSTTAALKRISQSRTECPKTAKRSKGKKSKQEAVLQCNDGWRQFSVKLNKLEQQLKNSQNALAFAFVEGALIKAIKQGHWVLLDEINLANAQTLECLSGLLEGPTGSLALLERGDRDSINRHPDFRIFAAMNPATDVGKKELPPGIRNRFTEFFVDELVDRNDLLLLCGSYLSCLALPARRLDSLVKFYLSISQEAINSLSDGTGQKPHYSLRTLCRALTVASNNPCGSIPRSLYEALLLSFLTQLDRSSHPIVEQMVADAVVGKKDADPKSLVHQPIPEPTLSGQKFIKLEGYWVSEGSLEPHTPEKYILTPTVRRNLRDLVRVVSLARLPVLLQGETSVGKTSLITYLAEASGNRCLRINNHEHTDLQEYIGCYTADEHGSLSFKEGVLVEAMRLGHWIILDELNLAPSDVLEALNRVLDDNRELFIPETQKVVKAHPNFMLFATQNPPGLYGGRKVLSRAFRNRFIELHFDEIPPPELETILHLRCDMPPSYCKKMVAVMSDLQTRRKGSAAFAGKQGFITLRDLFRWGERYRLAQQKPVDGQFYDWDQHIADEGFLILAGRVRKQEEQITIQECLAKHIKRSVEPERLFTLSTETSPVTRNLLDKILKETPPGFEHIVWTFNIRRLAVLLGKACEFKEPILLVGETGCGKTTLCQLLAASNKQDLASVNCHMHTESADFLGGLRPVRDHSEHNKGKLFEWVDGPLVNSMLQGGLFLADEISLADDSVLERLNSLLEPERKLLLAEKGTGVEGDPCEVVAKDNFIFVGTMNPGGDYGKKELSPALRNRFTEIWCEGCSLRSDLVAVIEHNLRSGLNFVNHKNEIFSVGAAIVDFLEWFAATELGRRFSRSIRDILTWVDFINVCTGPDVGLKISDAYIHGACLTFLDGLGSGLTSFCGEKAVCTLRSEAMNFLLSLVHRATGEEVTTPDSFLTCSNGCHEASTSSEKFGIDPFYIKKGPCHQLLGNDFLLSAPTTRLNAVRVLRALQLGKALLLEGSPGVGKTSLVAALARATGHKLTRINLSDQTDVSDLFGSDLPVEGGEGGQFGWRDGPFLQALRSGHWILLDELNLASQSVLEGLNAVLDHRGDLFIPELGRTFHLQPGLTRLFACQNPLNQGGARKGLPQSFLNRFTQVFMETLTVEDLNHICLSQFPNIPEKLLYTMVAFNQRVSHETEPGGKWGQRGAPWEMNLRDLIRWCQATTIGCENGPLNPGRFVQLIYADRMRSLKDKEQMKLIYEEMFSKDYLLLQDTPQLYVTPKTLYIGDVTMCRGNSGRPNTSLVVLRQQLPFLQSLARCVSFQWMSILVGPSGSGKTSLVQLLADLAGQELRTLSVNSAMDTTEILGGFEQTDYNRHFDELKGKAEKLVMKYIRSLLLENNEQQAKTVLSSWVLFSHQKSKTSGTTEKSVDSDIELFLTQMSTLLEILISIPKGTFTVEEKDQLSQLIKKSHVLKHYVTNDGSLNAGGKFEWVDSILIKSLLDGCWLLIDNVNLCSAAVLDRLNGLLEPQGALTIGERGVGPSGELVTIQPHPNFRLFLSLDPRNGEISRAMRNRGVEIFVLSSEENVLSSLSALDRCALLHEVGLKGQSEQLMLLHIHQVMADLTPGPEQPGLPELLHASFLVFQQIQRGMALQPAMLSACTKVYIQSRIADSAESKRRALSVLKDEILSADLQTPLELLDQLVPHATLRASEIIFNSRLAMARQWCCAISAVASVHNTAELEEVEAFLGISHADVNVRSLLRHLVLQFYQTSSPSGVYLGQEWLLNATSNTEYAEVIKILAEDLIQKLEIVCDLAEEDIMWDRRWLPDVAAAIAAKSKSNDHGVENRVSLLLFLTSLQLHQSFRSFNVKKLRRVSALDYSQAVHKGNVSNSLTDEPLIRVMAPLLDTVIKILMDALASIGVMLNNTQWWSLRIAIMWLQRILKQAASLPLEPDSKLVDETVSQLSVYYKWFSKHTIPAVNDLLKETLMANSHSSNALQKFLSEVPSESSLMWRLAKRIRAEAGQPAPLSSLQEASNYLKTSRLSTILNLWPVEGKPSQLLYFLNGDDGKRARLALAVAVRDLATETNFINVSERLDQVEEWVSKGGLMEDTTSGEETSSLTELNPEVVLWPFKELICLIEANAVLTKLLSKTDDSETNNEEILHLVQMMRSVPSIPAAFIGFMDALHFENTHHQLSYAHVWRHLFSTQSLAVTNLQPRTSNEKGGTKSQYLPQHCPVLSHLAGMLLFSQHLDSDELLSVTSLNQYESRSKMLLDLRALLWRNAPMFSNPHFSYRENEASSVKIAAYQFIFTLEKTLKIIPEENAPLSHRAESIVQQLHAILGSVHKLEFRSMLPKLVCAVDNIETSSDDDLQLKQVGLALALLGCLESQLYAILPPIDPKIKHALKLNLVSEEIDAITCELHAAKIMSSVRGYRPDSIPPHPHLDILHNHLQSLLLQHSTLKHHVAVRPDPPLYSDLKKDIQYYIGSIGSPAVISNIIQKLTGDLSFSETQKVIHEASTWLFSQLKFRTGFENRFGVWYPDIVQSIVSSNAKLCHGVEILVSLKKKLTLRGISSAALSEFVCSLGRFPLLSKDQPSIIAFISALSHKECSVLLEICNMGTLSESQTSTAREMYWLLKSSVLELRNLMVVSSSCDGKLWQALIDICRSFVLMWEKQEFERRERELDKESLYKSRGSTRCQTLSEEEEINLELLHLFPSSRGEDFGDLEAEDTLGDSAAKPSEEVEVEKLSELLSEEDAAMLCSLHLSLVQSYTRVPWLDPKISPSPFTGLDFITPWLQRFAVASHILVDKCHVLHDKVDKVLCSSWILAAALSSSGQTLYDKNSLYTNKSFYDFYHNSSTDEVRQCFPVLKSVADRVEQLLVEWPNHPSLNQIIIVIKRISSFSITSPVSRFLTGLEILLTKMKDWEENAHSGVSLASLSASVTNLVIQWRRLELSCWKSCLDSAAKRIIDKAARWWFYLFGLVEAHLRKFDTEEESPVKDIVRALEKFMEMSPLGEFHVRLEMLLAFHCHAVNIPTSDRQRELMVAFWNIFKFYSQFSDSVKSHISELRAPIDKNLKDYVKIARWNDINYWSVKEAVMRTQRTLHKHVREFEAVLKQSCKSVLVATRVEGKHQDAQMFPLFDPNTYVACRDLKISSEKESNLLSEEINHDSTLIRRAESLFSKARKLSKEIVLCSICPGSIASLNAFVGEIISSVQHLAEMKVDETLSKSKKVSQAKSQLQVKRKALADLFRMLQRVGLSYRTGLIYKDEFLFKFTTLQPLNVSATLKNVLNAEGICLSSADKALLSAWEGCDSYILRAWARFAHLRLALQSPHKDNGPINLERLKGFPSHLLALALDQQKGVAESLDLLLNVKLQLHYMNSLKDNLEAHIPCQSVLSRWKSRLVSLLVQADYTLQQFRLLLEACPEPRTSDELEDSIPVISSSTVVIPSISEMFKSDLCWQNVIMCVDRVISNIKQCKEAVSIRSYASQQGSFVSASLFKQMQKAFEDMQAAAADLHSIQKVFESESLMHPAIDGIIWLREQIRCESLEFFKSCSVNSSGEYGLSSENFQSNIHDLMFNILFAIESVYKITASPVVSELDECVDAEGSKEKEIDSNEVENMDLEEKQLSKLLQSVEGSLKCLNMKKISSSLKLIFTDLLVILEKEENMEKSNTFVRLALKIVPALQQWVLLCQFAVEQQVAALRTSCKLLSVILAVFGDVACKGFCTPEDLISTEEGEEGDGQSEGMGLGDGDGEKDVSERITSEDQLEGAHQEGQQEEKDEDKDCKEEQNAIEMSDNFESKHQDVEKNEEDEDDGDGDDEGEKEMGETEKDADQLDEQIWGADSDEGSDEEGEGKEEEDGNSGEQTGEKEIGAHEKDSKNQEQRNDEKDGKDKQTSKPDINEMKDPEENDDQIDPYHGNQQPEQEPEPMDLPDDLQLDEEAEGKDEDANEENPFDVDEMKEKMPPEPEKSDKKDTEDVSEDKKDTPEDDSSDEDGPLDPEQEADGVQPDEEEGQNDEDGQEETEDGGEGTSGKKQDDIEDESEEPESSGEKEQEKDHYPVKDDNPTGEEAQASEDTDGGATAPQETQAPEVSGVQPEEVPQEGDPGHEDRESIGQAPTNQQQKGHHDDTSGRRPKPDPKKRDAAEEDERQRAGHSEEQRSLGDPMQPQRKRLKTVDIKEADPDQDKETEEEGVEKVEDEADLYQHIKDAKDGSETQTLDAATEEQAEQQQVAAKEDEQTDQPPDDEQMDVDVDEEPEAMDEDAKKLDEEKTTGKKRDKERKEKRKPGAQKELDEERELVEVEGETVDTLGASRGPDTTYHTRYEALGLPNVLNASEVEERIQAVRLELQNQLASWSQVPAGEEATQAWQALSSVTNALARDLSEQLRLVLEPTQASRLKGDFRTGRRINMRKVIPFIASQFRKDKIWMRRTKPSKREYQILLAVDDSSSMADNRSKELAFESLALVSQALTLLEVGELGVVSFGETIKILHKLGEPFTHHSGARLLQQFSFDQRKTQIGALIDFVSGLMDASKLRTSAEHAQLVVVVSDGRGVFSEGQDKVSKAIRQARLSGVFLVFVIIDNPENKDSILDIRTPVFSGGKLVGISSYMDSFPFPFYLILRDISNLPIVLSDALRQWFELVTSTVN